MTITLGPETQKMLQDRMRLNGITSPELAIQCALFVMLERDSKTEDDRSSETLEAIRRGLADVDAGRSRPWEEVRKELLARHSQP